MKAEHIVIASEWITESGMLPSRAILHWQTKGILGTLEEYREYIVHTQFKQGNDIGLCHGRYGFHSARDAMDTFIEKCARVGVLID